MAVRRYAHRKFDLLCMGNGEWLVGIDEAGRGCLAGPVVAGCVVAHRSFYESVWCRRVGCRVDDSKKLSPEDREELFERIKDCRSKERIFVAAGIASVEEIWTHNILGATKLAMHRAAIDAAHQTSGAMSLPPPLDGDDLFQPELGVGVSVIIDGRRLSGFPIRHNGIVGGDSLSLVIGMASITAKVTRDRMMRELHEVDGRYGYDQHKGYCTPQHCEAIRTHGASEHHRMLFLRKLLAGDAEIHEQVNLELLNTDA